MVMEGHNYLQSPAVGFTGNRREEKDNEETGDGLSLTQSFKRNGTFNAEPDFMTPRNSKMEQASHCRDPRSGGGGFE